MPMALPQAASAAVQDFSTTLAAVRPQVEKAIRALCRAAGRDRAGDDAVMFEALVDALAGWDPAKGSLAARVVFMARRNLAGELPTNAQSIDDDADGSAFQVPGSINPETWALAREAVEADPAWLARQMADDTSIAIACAGGVSRRTAQRRLRAARQADTAQTALF